MTNEEKKAKLEELSSAVEYLNFCIDKEKSSENRADEIVAMAEIILRKAYDLYPDISRLFE